MNLKTSLAPFLFGATSRRMMGVLHFPNATSGGSRPAVVMCNPFGQEAIRAHRFLRTLAERLARAGHLVMRFDYFGTGDSMGEDHDFSLAGACQDVLTAHDELRRRSSSNGVVWVGMRLGATIALRASLSAPPSLSKLIVWDPIFDGSAYLEFLRKRHLDSIEHEYSLPLKPAPRKLALDPAYLRNEAIGFGLSPEFRREMEALRPHSVHWPLNPVQVKVLTDPSTLEGRQLEQAIAGASSPIETLVVQHDTEWTTDSAANTSLVPTVALMAIAQLAGAST